MVLGVAAHQQVDELIESIDRGIRCLVDYLLKVSVPNQVVGAVQGTATDIDIGTLDVGPIGMAATQRQEHDFSLEVLIGPEKVILRGFFDTPQS